MFWDRCGDAFDFCQSTGGEGRDLPILVVRKDFRGVYFMGLADIDEEDRVNHL